MFLMKHTIRLLFIFAVFTLLTTGCDSLRQPANKINYYTLEYDPPRIEDLTPLPVVIRVEKFMVAPHYNSNRIIYKDGKFKRDAYVYHKWRVNPGDIVTYYLTRDLRDSSLFKAVFNIKSRLVPTHIVEGMVDEFLELDEEDSWKAVLSVTITLMAANEPDISKRILYQKGYQIQKTCAQKNPQALAEAISHAMEEISRHITTDIYNHLVDTIQK